MRISYGGHEAVVRLLLEKGVSGIRANQVAITISHALCAPL
jgi:hypothetical protein